MKTLNSLDIIDKYAVQTTKALSWRKIFSFLIQYSGVSVASKALTYYQFVYTVRKFYIYIIIYCADNSIYFYAKHNQTLFHVRR